MMVSEETAKRIANSLERIERVLSRMERPPMMTGVYDPTKCLNCGGHHAIGLSCPLLAPTAGGI